MKNILILLMLIALFACRREANTIPEDVLSEQAMISLMADIQLIEAVLNLQKTGEVNAEKDLVLYSDSVLKSHNLSREKFELSFNYYAEHPELLERIYEEVINELSKRQAEAESTRVEVP